MDLLDKKADYERVVEEVSQGEFDEDFVLAFDCASLTTAANRLLSEPRPKIGSQHIVLQKLKVFEAKITVCKYAYQGEEYTFTSVGKRKVAYAPTSPVTKFCDIKDKIKTLRRFLKSTFGVWLSHTAGGLPKLVFYLGFLYLFVWTPVSCLLYWLLESEHHTSLFGPWWPGIVASLSAIILVGICYALVADKEELGKKQDQLNAPIFTQINELEAQLDCLRRG
jgi:hypothetical protein